MTETVNHAGSVQLMNIMRIRYLRDRISLPLEGSGVAFARLKHVTGIPVSGGGEGISFSKLKALDTLLDNLSRLKNVKREQIAEGKSSNLELDTLIEKYGREVHMALSRTQIYQGPSDVSGMLFQLSA